MSRPSAAPVRPGGRRGDEYNRDRNDAPSVTVARRSSCLSLALFGLWKVCVSRV